MLACSFIFKNQNDEIFEYFMLLKLVYIIRETRTRASKRKSMYHGEFGRPHGNKISEGVGIGSFGLAKKRRWSKHTTRT